MISDIANVLVAVLTIVIAIMGFILKGIYHRMDELEKNKCNKEMCDQKHVQVDKELARGDQKFSQLLTEMGQVRDIVSAGFGTANTQLELMKQRLDALDDGRLGRRSGDTPPGPK